MITEKIKSCESCPFVFNTPHDFECNHPKSNNNVNKNMKRGEPSFKGFISRIPPKECPLRNYPILCIVK